SDVCSSDLGKPTGCLERGGRGSSSGSGGGSGGDDDEEGACEKVETGRGDTEQAGAMTHSIDRLGVMRSLILAALALLLAACSLEYRASVPPVEDEVVVQAVAAAQAAYAHPVRLPEQALTKII